MCRTLSIASLVFIAAVGSSACAQAEVTIVRDGRPLASIVLSAQASPSEKWAAQDLADHIKQMSGAELRIVTENDAVPQPAVILGDGPAAKARDRQPLYCRWSKATYLNDTMFTPRSW